MTWYKTGTVSVVNGQTSITGTGTKFATNSRVGDAFRGPDGYWYEVLNIASETVLGIYPEYQGVTVSDSSDYTITPIQGYNKDTADRLRAITDTFTVVSSVAGRTGDVVLSRSDVGLSNVDNTSDLNKPISTASQTKFTEIDNNITTIKSDITTDKGDIATLKQNVVDLNAGLSTTNTNVSNKANKGANSDITELNGLTKQITTAQGGVSKAHIDGLFPSFVTSGLTISQGSAYIPGISKTVVVETAITLTGITGLTSDVFYYAYLYLDGSTPNVEVSSTSPSSPYQGSARTKSGDNTRRFICALRTGAGGTLYRFQWGSDGYIRYLVTTGAAPFRVLNGSTLTAKTNVATSSVVPPTTQITLANLINGGTTQSFQLSHPDTSGNDILLTVPSSSRMVTPVALDSQQRFAFFNSAAGGSAFADILGYGTDR